MSSRIAPLEGQGIIQPQVKPHDLIITGDTSSVHDYRGTIASIPDELQHTEEDHQPQQQNTQQRRHAQQPPPPNNNEEQLTNPYTEPLIINNAFKLSIREDLVPFYLGGPNLFQETLTSKYQY